MLAREGPGWRLARDPLRGEFSVLIGGDSWAIELTESEWSQLVLLVSDLINQHHGYKNRLMNEEEITLEIERLPWWGCLNGNKNSWSLKLILTGDSSQKRGVEMYWPIPIAQSMASEMRIMWDSCQ